MSTHQVHIDETHRHEIAATMNAVIRACQDVITAHSHQGRWIPGGITEPAAPCLELDRAARRQVLNGLLTAIDCATAVLIEVERDHEVRPSPKPGV